MEIIFTLFCNVEVSIVFGMCETSDSSSVIGE